MSNELPYSVRRLSLESRVPRRTILNHIDTGVLPAVKLSEGATSAWVIPAADAKEYIARTERGAA